MDPSRRIAGDVPTEPAAAARFRLAAGESPIKSLSWGARVLYVGPGFELSPHSHAVGLICICLDGEMEVLAGEALERGYGHVCRSVYIQPGAHHLIRFATSRIGCLFVDGVSDDPTRLVRAMRPQGDGLFVEHEREAVIAATLRDFADGRIERDRRKAVIADAFGLSNPCSEGQDPRISTAVRRILENPDAPNRAATLAAEAGLSVSRFRRAFRDVTGVPLRRFRLWARIRGAMEAITAGANLTEAAHDAGFSSSAHLSSACRAMHGMTPSQFAGVARAFGQGGPLGASRRSLAGAPRP